MANGTIPSHRAAHENDPVIYGQSLRNQVFGECFIEVAEPKLQYLVLGDSGRGSFVVYPEDQLQLPPDAVLKIVDIKTNAGDSVPLVLSMAGGFVRWQEAGSAGLDASKLTDAGLTPLEVTRNGCKLGRILLKRGDSLGLISGEKQPRPIPVPVRY